MKQNEHTKLIKDVMTNEIDVSNNEKKLIYKDSIRAFKSNLYIKHCSKLAKNIVKKSKERAKRIYKELKRLKAKYRFLV